MSQTAHTTLPAPGCPCHLRCRISNIGANQKDACSCTPRGNRAECRTASRTDAGLLAAAYRLEIQTAHETGKKPRCGVIPCNTLASLSHLLLLSLLRRGCGGADVVSKHKTTLPSLSPGEKDFLVANFIVCVCVGRRRHVRDTLVGVPFNLVPHCLLSQQRATKSDSLHSVSELQS
ncbi:hypothetical protein N657DRAFT_47788 [Parathielavia appendiculata]|uniref:Uncharacterized protein n=1 Tax=Parathielavia appendiculata TaxID=2587402 RepID=A0AAN6U9Y2_9PEZI|nr:hypothetical protein N657DRAFT_47788 [Parathielavia appendiculata]